MALIVLTDAKLAFGHVDLLANTAFSLESGERVGLIGRNGTGKSSLLKILAGIEKMDDGLLQYQQGLRIACSEGVLVITQLQPPGKKAMSAADFLNGRADWLSPGTLIGQNK